MDPQRYDSRVSERKTIFEGRVVKLSIENDKWEIIEHKPAVAILALEHGKMLLVKQFRPAIGDFALEIPAGLIEPFTTSLNGKVIARSSKCSMMIHDEPVIDGHDTCCTSLDCLGHSAYP